MKDEELYFWNGPRSETQAPPRTGPEPWGETKVVGAPDQRRCLRPRQRLRRVSLGRDLPDMLQPPSVVLAPHAMVKKVDAPRR